MTTSLMPQESPLILRRRIHALSSRSSFQPPAAGGNSEGSLRLPASHAQSSGYTSPDGAPEASSDSHPPTSWQTSPMNTQLRTTEAPRVTLDWQAHHGRALGHFGQVLSVASLILGAAFWARWLVLDNAARTKAAATAGAAEQSSLRIPSAPYEDATVGDPFSPVRALLAGLRSGWGQRTDKGETTDEQPTTSSRGAGATTSVAPGPSREAPKLEPDWWRGLNQIHYISFGAQFGVLPIVLLQPPSSSHDSTPAQSTLTAMLSAQRRRTTGTATCLVAFEDPGDAEFVAATMRANLIINSGRAGANRGQQQLPPSPSLTPRVKSSVMAGSPLFLEDLAQMQGARLGVIPQGLLSRSARLSDSALQDLLAGIINTGGVGSPPPPPPPAPSAPKVAVTSGSGTALSDTVPGVDAADGSLGPAGVSPEPQPLSAAAGVSSNQPSSLSSSTAFKFEFSGFKPPLSPPQSKRSSAARHISEAKPNVMESQEGLKSLRVEDPKVSSTESQPSSPSAELIQLPKSSTPFVEGGNLAQTQRSEISNVGVASDLGELLIEDQQLELLRKMDERVSLLTVLMLIRSVG